ncbi:flavin monoamine oxidase family protein [Streptomyces sp. 2A115]|uniref:flavin monoamine oxidase family protein n=1 Tax=Streptomyces sp. 2A115 TaxID=3457439 RepID=UPI003FCF3FF9
MAQHLTTDVVIVGAGFAGLSAADQLTAQGYGVVVLEGRSRVGGRSFGGEIAGVPIDLGAAWVGARHPELLELAQRFDCATLPQYHEGKNVLNLGGRRSTYRSDIPPVSPITLLDMGRVKYALDRLTSTVDLETPWKTPNAHALDAMTFGDWLRRKRATAKTRALMETISKVQWGCPSDEVSMLHVLTGMRALGGLDHMLAVEGGVEQDRFAVSLHQIAVRLAASLGDRVLTDTAVRRIEQDADGITIHTDGPSVQGRRVLVATAASQSARVLRAFTSRPSVLTLRSSRATAGRCTPKSSSG